MQLSLLPHEILETGESPDASIIWLHGLGANGHDFEGLIPELNLPKSLKIRFIFPHAPIRPVTVNGGLEMRAWYDIKSISIEREIDVDDFSQTNKQILNFIKSEINRGIDSSRILLAGFSQGGAVAYYTGLRSPYALGGLLVLSAYIPIEGEPNKDYPEHSKHYPIFIAHGQQDPVVPLSLGQKAKTHLEKNKYKVEFREYPMPHSLCVEEIKDISAFIQKTFA